MVQAASGVALDIQEAEGILGISKMVASPGDVSVEVPVEIRSLGTNISVQKMPSSGVPAHMLEFQVAFAFPIDALVNALLEFQQQMAGPLAVSYTHLTLPTKD